MKASFPSVGGLYVSCYPAVEITPGPTSAAVCVIYTIQNAIFTSYYHLDVQVLTVGGRTVVVTLRCISIDSGKEDCSGYHLDAEVLTVGGRTVVVTLRCTSSNSGRED